MSISSAIVNAQQKVTNAYTAVNNKGGTLPATQNLSNLPTAISSIPTGSTPTGTISITQNGTYDVTNYASANVNVSGGGGGIGITREVSADGVYQMPASSFTFSLPSTATDVGDYAMYYVFYYCTGLTGVDLSSLITVSGNNAMYCAFQQCTDLTSVDLSSLTTVSGRGALQSAFNKCTGLTSVDLSSLTTVSSSSALNSTFYECTNITGSLDLSSLTTVSGQYAFSNTFYRCTGLTSVDLSSLTTVSATLAFSGVFGQCTGISSINFNNLEIIGSIDGSSTNYGQFSTCFNNCNNLTSLTFPKLEKIYCTGGNLTSYGTFNASNKIQKFYFPKLDTITYGTGASSSNQNACKYIFNGCSALTELHFAAANQSAIEASPGYSTAWGRGAGNVTIYFDL